MHAPDPSVAPSPSHRTAALLAFAVAAVTVAVFALSLGGGFVQWDDDRNFLRNPHYRGLGWTHVRWMFSTTLLGHWIPLTWMTFGLDFLLWGMNPVGYHLTNVVLHAVNAALFFVLALQLLRLALASAGDGALRMGAAVAALFFAVHPLRVESVAWVTERRDVLSGLFYLLTLIAYVRMCGSSGVLRRRWRLLSLVAYAMALLSKSIVMSLPLVLIVLDIYPLRRWPGRWRQWTTPEARAVLREKLPYAAMALAGGLLAAVVLSRTLEVTSMTAYPMPARLAMAAYALVFYLRKTILPAALSPLYELPARIELLDPQFLGSAVAAVLITVALIAARRRWPAGLAAWAVYALTLGPVLGIVHNGPQLVADRYSYLACLGWALLLGGAVVRLIEARAPDGRAFAPARVALAAVAIWVAALATLTWSQTRVWKDTDAIWRQALEVDPDCAFCHRQWGAVLGNRGELERAIMHFTRAVELRPDRVSGHGNVGLALLKAGRPAEAVVHFARVLQDAPGNVDVRSRLGAALIQQGRLAEARVELERAVRDDPRHPDALTNLGLALVYLGRPTEARPYLERASALEPASALPHVGLARAFLALGDGNAAARHAATARQLDPGLAAHMLPPR